MRNVALKPHDRDSLSFVPKEIWEREFGKLHTIPSSTRCEPAKALTLFTELLNLRGSLSVLDAGSGNGRNAVYLAKRGCKVTAIDFCEAAFGQLQRRIATENLESQINIVNHRLDGELPFSNATFDVALDSYTSCHFLDDAIFNHFWQEMKRVTRKDGTLISILFPPEDEYYAHLHPHLNFVSDPANGVTKRLYSEQEIKDRFSETFHFEYFAKFEFDDIVLGETFKRVVLICVLKNS
jgi:SAM-dependent methyltransferase